MVHQESLAVTALCTGYCVQSFALGAFSIIDSASSLSGSFASAASSCVSKVGAGACAIQPVHSILAISCQ